MIKAVDFAMFGMAHAPYERGAGASLPDGSPMKSSRQRTQRPSAHLAMTLRFL